MAARKKSKQKRARRRASKKATKKKSSKATKEVQGELLDQAGTQMQTSPAQVGDIADTFTAAVNGIESDKIQGLIKSVIADATTAEEVKDRTAAANAFTRMVKVCHEISKPSAPKVNVNVNVDADESLADTIARMRAAGAISAQDEKNETDN